MRSWVKVFLFFFMAGLLVYFNSLNNKFLIDDYFFINNPVLSTPKFISSQWNPYREQALGVLDSHESLKYYRPMTHIVYDLCYSVFKNNYWQYHFLNLFLFVIAASLIYLLIERVSGNFNLALLTGLFYLIHPINGIVVNYISASVFALQVIFMLGAILFLVESLDKKNNRVLYSLSLLLSFLSLFWHESGMMTPFYVFSFVLLFRKEPLRTKINYLFPYFFIVSSYIVFRCFFLNTNENFSKQIALFHMTAGEYFGGLFQVFSWYISKLFYPQGIVMQWVTPILHSRIIFNIGGVFLLFGSLLFLLVRFFKEKILKLALIWTLVGFAPVFLAAFIRSNNCAAIEPHWFIFSSIGFFILAASFCLFVLNRMKLAGVILLFSLIFTWGAVSHFDNRFWADQKTYALYWSKQNPDLQSIDFYLADAYMHEGALEESRKYFRSALSGYPSDADVYNNLGVIDFDEGHYKNAELNYQMSLKIDPYLAGDHYDLGFLYLSEGKLDKAKENFDRALALNPMLMEPRRGLASILILHSEYQKAIKLCLENLSIVHDDKKTFLLLVNIFLQKKDFVNLKKYADSYIKFEDDPKLLTSLGVTLAQNNLPIIALDCFEKAIRLAPDYNEAYLNGGTLFFNLGKYEDAIRMWRIGLSIDPSDQRFKRAIARTERLK